MKQFRLFRVVVAALALVAVSCQQAPFLTMNGPKSINFSKDGGSQSFTFSTNKDWKVSSSETWCVVSPSSGSAADGNVTVTVTVVKNTGYDPRTCTVTVNIEDLSETITVAQSYTEEIVANTQQVNVSWKPETVIVNIQTNTDFEVAASDPSWCVAEVLPTKGLAGVQLSLTLKANVDFTPRTQNVIIKQKEGSIERQLTVNQGAPEEMVDLGLSVKWRAFNLGAETILGSGNYYAWGETETKEQYLESNYKWYKDGDIKQVTKYNILGNSFNPGFPEADGKYILEPEDDIATATLGGDWRLPTYFEAKELIENCSVEYVADYYETGIPGFVFTSQVIGFEGATLFMPLTGYFTKTLKHEDTLMEMWTSTKHIFDGMDSMPSLAMAFAGNTHLGTVATVINDRDIGLPVRPVCDNQHHTLGVSINEPQGVSKGILEGYGYQLNAQIYPSNGAEQVIHWASEDESIATVSQDGLVTGVSPGSVHITANVDNGVSASQLFIVQGKQDEEYVDLGLSVLWATRNLGAESFEKNGDYYAWGETALKPYYSWDDYVWGTQIDISTFNFTKYLTQEKYGTVDNLVELESQDDVANVILGDGWRMPTAEEVEELIQNTYIWRSYNFLETGITMFYVGSKVSGYEDKYIYFPSAEYAWRDVFSENFGIYWSATLNKSKNERAMTIDLDLSKLGSARRAEGHPIRPVKNK